ncbi:MAG: hypothetical protein ACXWWK_07965 [Gemmatimonadales bacterium]
MVQVETVSRLTVRVPSDISERLPALSHLDDELLPVAGPATEKRPTTRSGSSVFSLSFPRAVLPAYWVLAVCLTTTKALSAQTAATVQIGPTDITLPPGECQQFSARAYDAAGAGVVTAGFVYSLSNPADFTLKASDNGYVCSNATLAAGSATQITVAVPGTRARATTTLTVPPAPGAQAPLPGDMSISRDLVLERAALSERDKIDGMLSPSAKLKVNGVSETFLNTLLRDNNDVDPSPFVREAMGREFGQLSSQQSDLLTFYALAGVVQLFDEKQAIHSGLSEEDMLRLQRYMDRRSRFQETLSNLLKKYSETAQAITQNLK